VSRLAPSGGALARYPLTKLYLEFMSEPTRFLQQHPVPWLILPGEPQTPDSETKTKIQMLPASNLVLSPTRETAWAIEILKTEANVFGLGVTLGRTANNDIAISDERISRFHAYFQLDAEAWTLADAGSSNGTYLGGQRLVPRKPTRLPPKAALSFGGCELRYYEAGALVEYLRSI